MKLDQLLRMMEERMASDLYLKVGQPPHMRIGGQLMPISETPPQTREDIEKIARQVLDDKQFTLFQGNREMDISYTLEGGLRFRVNLFFQQGTIAAVIRRIKQEAQTFQELNLPIAVMEKLSLEPRGLVLMAGSAGSGKSTTMAGIINYINHRKRKHIITIEDPIEFSYQEELSIINQREVGFDTHTFKGALKYVIRQAPDVIVIGEMRDLETMTSAIMAAEVGHLVLSSLHTIDVGQTLERIINFFPAFQHPQIRMQLSFVLRGVVAQRLLPRKDGQGMIPACEVMVTTPTVRKLINDGRPEELTKAIENSNLFGMQTFNQAILALYQAGKITYEVAMENADHPELLELSIRGIFSGQDTFRAQGTGGGGEGGRSSN